MAVGKSFTTWAEELADHPGLRLAEDGAAWPGYGAFAVPVPDTDEGLWAGGCRGEGPGLDAGKRVGLGGGDTVAGHGRGPVGGWVGRGVQGLVGGAGGSEASGGERVGVWRAGRVTVTAEVLREAGGVRVGVHGKRAGVGGTGARFQRPGVVGRRCNDARRTLGLVLSESYCWWHFPTFPSHCCTPKHLTVHSTQRCPACPTSPSLTTHLPYRALATLLLGGAPDSVGLNTTIAAQQTTQPCTATHTLPPVT